MAWKTDALSKPAKNARLCNIVYLFNAEISDCIIFLELGNFKQIKYLIGRKSQDTKNKMVVFIKFNFELGGNLRQNISQQKTLKHFSIEIIVTENYLIVQAFALKTI